MGFAALGFMAFNEDLLCKSQVLTKTFAFTVYYDTSPDSI
jgi:hypothetical protein